MPVYFYIKEGPAIIKDGKLVFTKIPPRSQFPIKVTVAAWQYGRDSEPKIKSAEPVEQTFYILNSSPLSHATQEKNYYHTPVHSIFS